MRSGSTAKVLTECKLKYYRISEWEGDGGDATNAYLSAALRALLAWVGRPICVELYGTLVLAAGWLRRRLSRWTGGLDFGNT